MCKTNNWAENLTPEEQLQILCENLKDFLNTNPRLKYNERLFQYISKTENYLDKTTDLLEAMNDDLEASE